MTTSDIHIQASGGPAYMQPADFQPFLNCLAEAREERLIDWADRYLAGSAHCPSDREELAQARHDLIAQVKAERVLWGFMMHHYPVGSVFDYHGIPAMVETSSCSTTGWGQWLEVVAVVRDSVGGLQRLTIKEKLALALVWRKFGLGVA